MPGEMDHSLARVSMFDRMEETVRSLLQNQGVLEHTAMDTVDLMKAYKPEWIIRDAGCSLTAVGWVGDLTKSKPAAVAKNIMHPPVTVHIFNMEDKLSEEVRKQRESLEKPGPPEAEVELQSDSDADGDGSGAEGDKDKESKLLLERLRALEAENSALAMENESQREQYERCLDEVANQVVQALLTQKDLREECLKLRTRVFDLEQQNRTLSVLFQQRVRPASDLLLQWEREARHMEQAGPFRQRRRDTAAAVSVTRDSPRLRVKAWPVISLQAPDLPEELLLYDDEGHTAQTETLHRSQGGATDVYELTCGALGSKLHSKIMGLSVGDLSLEPERSKGFLLSRSTDSPPHDTQLNGKAGLPAGKCPSQLSLTVPVAAYSRSSCSSSELSISSACSDFSNSSYTWNEGKPSSLTWEKRGSLGSSAPSNICAPPEEQPPTRRKECHILEGLKRLQRRRPKQSPSLISKSGYKDCMNSNEGIYSLGLKSGGQGVAKAPTTGKSVVVGSRGNRKFAYDSDDADDESSRAPPGGGCWTYSTRLTHSLSDSLCSWEGGQGGGDVPQDPQMVTYDSKELPEKLIPSILNSFRTGGKTQASLSSSLLPFEVSPTEADHTLLRLSDTDEAEDLRTESSSGGERPERDAGQTSDTQAERRCHGRAQSADGRPRPLSLLLQQKAAKSTQSEESVAAIFDADGEPIELGTQHVTTMATVSARIPMSQATSVPLAEYSVLVPQEETGDQTGSNARNYSVLESPEKPAELLSHGTVSKASSREGSASSFENAEANVTSQRKLIKPSYSRAHKVHSVPPMHSVSSTKANLTKIPARGRGSPMKATKGSTVEMGTGNSGTIPASSGQERSPSSPPVKLSRFIKPPGSGSSSGCSQSSKTSQAGSRLPSRTEWAKNPSSSIPGSPLLSRRHLEHIEYGEQPTRDGQQQEVRSPSPPPPPGRTTSLLIRPNYDSSPQAPKADAGHSTETIPQKLVEGSGHHLQKSTAASSQTPTRGSPKRGPIKLFHSSSASGQNLDPHETVVKSSRNILQKGSSLQSTLGGKKVGLERDGGYPMLYKTSGSLPTSLQGHIQSVTEPQAPPGSIGLGTSPQNSVERASKMTRIPMGFKALVKSPSSQKESSSVAAKQDKDHVNTACKGTSTSGSLDPRGIPSAPLTVASALASPKHEGRLGTRSGSMDRNLPSPQLAEHEEACERVDGESRLFKRSISVTTKPHLKPALGMNGAKARSQSFSTNYMERPNIVSSDGPGKIRTQIITNTGERGNSLTRQSSLGDGFQLKSATGLGEAPPSCSFSRQGLYVSTSSSQPSLPIKGAPKASPKGEAVRAMPKGEAGVSSPQKEIRNPPLADRFGLKSSARQPAKVAPQLQPDSPSSPICSPDSPPEAIGSRSLSPGKVDPTKNGLKQGQGKRPEEAEKLASSTACTIEEKVMMGIQENMQRGQGQDKTQAPEGKQKTGPSLANWFGLRKSKLPALGGKKADATKGKEEKKELKMGSVLGGKQSKLDKKKEKKKAEIQHKGSCEQAAMESNDKLSLIMDGCSVQMGQLTNQIQNSTSYVGKDLLMKEFLNR
ncbi:hypothetical protein JZ751_028195 [Albula glossodonta]|uniref:Nck-associated protein 5 C-terminal domain-containing protein n=1 Tax=Albula glossodonta TaxID=121402 RepID=A0A8T2PL26_9TELE|nr:hypothetical protein JZ751_028195 [Albula glossodonta]